VGLTDFQNWSGEISVTNVWKAVPNGADDIVTIANWAAVHGYKVRALGKSHNWSPLVVQRGEDVNSLLLVSTENLQGRTFWPGPVPQVTLGAGVTIDDATDFLQNQAGNSVTAAPGYTFLNFTEPGDLTIGGVLAVGGHGTGIPVEGEPELDGCLSNLVTRFTAVVSDASGQYGLRTFERADPDAAALLVHLGRAFITDATLAVVPDYYLQVTNRYPLVTTLLEAPGADSPDSLSQLVQTYGRVEVIWFPFTDLPWVKTWERVPGKIKPQVGSPYNYPWAMDISPEVSGLISDGLHLLPHLTPWFAAGELIIVITHAPPGAALNGPARDLLLYVKPTTALMGMAGYAIQVPLDGLQAAANAFYVKFQSLLETYHARGEYPTNGGVEMRVTTVDRVAWLGIAGAAPPALSVCNPAGGQSSQDVVFWVDSLTFPGTEHAGDFYQELEEWFLQEWGPAGPNVLRPEWSKGWAYAGSGPWTNPAVISGIPAAYPGFAEAQATLARYDAANIYSNSFLVQLLPPPDAKG
jgi:FAD/FMN-containing dehydrogenase